jgi:5'-deoxynucleotidase YfbR-like HD superfamily hydrolase
MTHPIRDDVFELFEQLLIPSATVFRTIKLQPDKDRFENDAEHGYLLATLGCALASRMKLNLDLGKVSQYALVHDLVEVFAGDTSIWASAEAHLTKPKREADALAVIQQRFGYKFGWIDENIKVYEAQSDPESCYVYALDKIIPYIVMAAVDHQPFPPDMAVYKQKMVMARNKVASYPPLLSLFDAIDEDYRRRPHFLAM